VIVTLDRRDLPPASEKGSVVSIGVFDGMHLGHRAIVRANLARARELGAAATVVTFREHPKKVLLGRAPRTLTSLQHRLELFRRAGIEHAVALTFDEELRATPAEDFVRDFLVAGLGARSFVLGFDSKFGKDRRGTPEFVRALGHAVEVVPRVVVGERAVSSTAIREAVELGDLDAAERMLGRPPALYGDVVHGQHVGTGIGFPTANLDLHHELHPPPGVYACRARLLAQGGPDRSAPGGASDGNGERRWPAVANIGWRPTLGGEPPSLPTVEVHVIGFAGDLYGRALEVEFLARLRDEQRFAGLDELRAQIARDVERARELIARRSDEPRADRDPEAG
jgi:riboflavin kinase/FMN adenylyltransferase